MSAPNKISFSDYDFTDLENYPNVGKDKSGTIVEFSHDGNSLLRSAGCSLPYTDEVLKEIEKCKNDKEYFWENYCYIQTLDHGKIHPKLRDYQREFLNLIDNNRKVIGKLSRQSGKTVSNALYITWCLIFKKDFTVGIVANTSDLTLEIVSMIKEMFELLPPWLQVGVKKWNSKSITLENGNKILSAVAGPSALRGKSINLVLLDEFAHIDETKVKGFIDSVMPTLSSGHNTKIIMISTPKGFNTFHRYWKEAEEGINGYVTFSSTWEDVPGRDEQWKDAEIASDGIQAFLQNHVCAFLGSSSTLLSPEQLEKLDKKNPIFEGIGDVDNVKVYEDYDPDATYVIGVDSSKTVGKVDANNDYICIQVLKLDKEKKKIKQCAVFRTNEIHYKEIANVAQTIGEYYGSPLIIVENNEGAGTYAAETLTESYDSVYFDPSHAKEIAGVRTTTKRKSVGLSNIRKMIEKDILEINDSKTIDEFFTYVKSGKSYNASSGETDDCIMSINVALMVLLEIENELDITIEDFLNDVKADEESYEEDLDFTDILYSDGITKEDLNWLIGSK